MSWLCDFCGYENEFNDEFQSSTCLCCGEKASRDKLVNARRELKAYHREETRRLYLERCGRRRELWQRKIGMIAKSMFYVTKAMPLVMAAIIVLSFARVGVSFGKNDIAGSQIVRAFSTLTENAKTRSEDYVSNCLDNGKAIEGTLSERNGLLCDNMEVTAVNVENSLRQMWEQFPSSIQNMRRSFYNMRSNWRLSWNRAKSNVQELITTITKR